MQPLNLKQHSIITMAAFTANGEREKLKTALHLALDAGMSINQIKEILVQLYAYTGFPRSLNSLSTFQIVLEERQNKGINDEQGKEASVLPETIDKDAYGARVRAELLGQKEIPHPSGYQLFAPIIDTFLKQHLFADIFSRDIVSYQERELATIAALSAMIGTEPQLQAHLGICFNVGWRQEQLEAFTQILEKEMGMKEGHYAHDVLMRVLHNRN